MGSSGVMRHNNERNCDVHQLNWAKRLHAAELRESPFLELPLQMPSQKRFANVGTARRLASSAG